MPTNDELFEAVQVERVRCVNIIQACRFGELDRDWRSVIAMLESGKTDEELKAEGSFPS